MNFDLQSFISKCQQAADSADAQRQVESLLRGALTQPGLAEALAGYAKPKSMADMVVYRSQTLTLLAATIPPGFRSGPHNHNLWSVVGAYDGQEDNEFFERKGDGLVSVGKASVVAPDVLSNAPEIIHAIHNPLDTPLRAFHAYGGDLLATARSTWDPDTHREIPFDFDKTIPSS